MTNAKRISKADKAATKQVANWFASVKERAARSVIADPDTRLVYTTYSIPGMGTKVETMRSGTVVAWFESESCARSAINAAT
jgi:hypothetical protein